MDSLLYQSQYIAAFIVGLMGGVHCLGMCGGIVGALSLSSRSHATFTHKLSILISYNAGRIISYTLAGLLAGYLGSVLVDHLSFQWLKSLLTLLAGGFMIALGFYLSGWWFGIAHIERIGKPIWAKLEPISKHFLPIKHPIQALPLGLIWGWLPCGLVYSVLLWPMASHSPIDGALIMLSFGLGTLPNLLLMGALTTKLAHWLHKSWVKQVAGSFVIIMGILVISRLL